MRTKKTFATLKTEGYVVQPVVNNEPGRHTVFLLEFKIAKDLIGMLNISNSFSMKDMTNTNSSMQTAWIDSKNNNISAPLYSHWLDNRD